MFDIKWPEKHLNYSHSKKKIRTFFVISWALGKFMWDVHRLKDANRKHNEIVLSSLDFFLFHYPLLYYVVHVSQCSSISRSRYLRLRNVWINKSEYKMYIYFFKNSLDSVFFLIFKVFSGFHFRRVDIGCIIVNIFYILIVKSIIFYGLLVVLVALFYNCTYDNILIITTGLSFEK